MWCRQNVIAIIVLKYLLTLESSFNMRKKTIFSYTLKFKKNVFYVGAFFMCISCTGCKKEYKFWDINKFSIQNGALEDNAEIKLLYFSGGPTPKKSKFYYHVIAITLSNDTFNILTPDHNGFTIKSGDEIYNFYDDKNLISLLSNNQLKLDSTTSGKKIEELEISPLDTLKKVIRNPKFDYIADNNFPTVIGTIGKTTPN